MNLGIESRGDIKIVRVKEERLVYSMLGSFFAEISKLIEAGAKKVVLDMSAVAYIDSASVGCLMDIYRSMAERAGVIRLLGLQERVETMVSMTGLHNFMELYRDESAAIESLSGKP
jgi:anti-sigma B factor antagonist